MAEEVNKDRAGGNVKIIDERSRTPGAGKADDMKVPRVGKKPKEGDFERGRDGEEEICMSHLRKEGTQVRRRGVGRN
jgi:hypothetical protein